MTLLEARVKRCAHWLSAVYWKVGACNAWGWLWAADVGEVWCAKRLWTRFERFSSSLSDVRSGVMWFRGV